MRPLRAGMPAIPAGPAPRSRLRSTVSARSSRVWAVAINASGGATSSRNR